MGTGDIKGGYMLMIWAGTEEKNEYNREVQVSRVGGGGMWKRKYRTTDRGV